MGHRYHQMELVPGVKPPTKAPYRKSLLELQELRQQLSKMLDVGYVKPLKAPYGAPIFFQRNQNGSMWVCINCRALNKVMAKNKYPVPLIQNLLDWLSKATYFTKLALRWGY